MKTSLEEARKRATQALLYEHTCPDTGRQFLCAAGIDNDVAEVFDHVGMPRANSALLAHCWNHFDEVVAALENLLEYSQTGRVIGIPREDDLVLDSVAAVLARAKEV